MPVYLVGAVNKRDEALYARYIETAAPTFEGHPAKILSLSDDPMVLEGSNPPGRIVLLEFPDKDAAMAWYRSETYQNEAIPIRLAAADTQFLAIIEG